MQHIGFCLIFSAQSLWNEQIKNKMNDFFKNLILIVKQAYIDDGDNTQSAGIKAKELVSNIIGRNLIKITSVG